MIDPNVFYEAIKFWLPMTTALTLVVKAYLGAKRGVSGWAEQLLSNHLSHIQTATETTVQETRETNKLLTVAAQRDLDVATKVVEVKDTLQEHHEKQQVVWNGILNTLTVLEDRTRRSVRKTRSPRRKR